MASSTPIRLAIIGGGLGGLSLANALVRRPPGSDQSAQDHPGFEIHVYEAKSSFSERGAAVGLSNTAKTALKYCVPDANDTLRQAGGVPMVSSLMMIGSGPYAGAEVFNSDNLRVNATDSDEQRTTVVYRPSLMASLLKALESSLDPMAQNESILRTDKKLTSITSTRDDKVQLVFEDGQVEIFDAVVGADGYRGIVRNYVLGDKAEDENVSASGFWDCRNMVSMETAKRVLLGPLRDALRSQTEDRDKVSKYFGEDLDCHRQWAWAGNAGFVMHDVCENGTMMQCVISSIEKEPWQERKKVLTREFLEDHLQGWDDGPVFSAMLDLLFIKDQPGQGPLHGWSQWHHKKTSTYSNGRVCIVGDAAHATTPWQGSGVGMAIEDAMILSHLLWNISSHSSIAAAFETFTEIFCAQEPDLGHRNPTTGVVELDPKMMMGALMNRWDKIRSLSHQDHRDEALARLKQKVGTIKV